MTTNWRKIEVALHDFLGGTRRRNSGDIVVEIEADDDLENDCEDCPFHFAYLNLTSLAKFLAAELGGDA
jgi:hypothetical protein